MTVLVVSVRRAPILAASLRRPAHLRAIARDAALHCLDRQSLPQRRIAPLLESVPAMQQGVAVQLQLIRPGEVLDAARQGEHQLLACPSCGGRPGADEQELAEGHRDGVIPEAEVRLASPRHALPCLRGKHEKEKEKGEQNERKRTKAERERERERKAKKRKNTSKGTERQQGRKEEKERERERGREREGERVEREQHILKDNIQGKRKNNTCLMLDHGAEIDAPMDHRQGDLRRCGAVPNAELEAPLALVRLLDQGPQEVLCHIPGAAKLRLTVSIFLLFRFSCSFLLSFL